MSLIKTNIDSLIAALIGMVFIIVLTQHSGLGISPDSIYYMSAADNFIAGKGFYQFDDKPFVMFPVFYPFILAGVKVLFGNLNHIAPYFNSLLFGMTIFMSGSMLEKTNHVKWVKWIVLLFIILSPSLLEIYTMLWSETLFISEVILFIWVSKLYFEKYQIKHLILLASIAAIAADTRLAGVTIIATGGVLILMNHDLGWNKKIKHAFVFGLIACSLCILNLVRNVILAQTLTGNRQKGVTPFLENLKYYGWVISEWLPFSNWTKSFPLLFGFIFLILIIGVFFYRLINKIEHNSYEKIAATFTLMYSLFMLFVATISRFETINNRLLAPFFIPCFFTISFYLVSIFKILKSVLFKGIFIVMVTGLLLPTIYQYLTKDLATINENKQGGIGGYSDDDWLITSELLNFLQSHPTFFIHGQQVYSNAAHAIYFRTQQHVQILPERKYEKLVKSFNELPTQMLIWFNNEDNPEVLTINEISKYKNLQIIGKFNDGVIYVCTSK